LEYTGNWTKALYIREKDKQYGALAKSLKEKETPIYLSDVDLKRTFDYADFGVCLEKVH